MRGEVDERTLMRQVAHAGVEVSADQLKRWRRGGLVPRPRQEHARGLRGSRSWYPPWTADQLEAVARLHQTAHRLDELRVDVWWAELWVEPRAVRASLVSLLDRTSAKARAIRGEHRDASEAADAIVSATNLKSDASAAVRLMRRRLGHRRDDLLNVLWVLLVLGLGGELVWEAEDEDEAPSARELLERAGGMDRAKRESVADGEPWLPSTANARDYLSQLRDAGAFNVEDLARPIREASDEDLEQARADAHLFADRLSIVGNALEGLLGEDVAGLGSLAALVPDDSWDRAALVRNMVILRRITSAQAFAEIARMVDEVHDRSAAIVKLRATFPQYGGLLRLDMDRRLAALPRPEAARARAELNTYLDKHPDIAAALLASDAEDTVTRRASA